MGVIGDARERGFELEERVIGDAWVWGWAVTMTPKKA